LEKIIMKNNQPWKNLFKQKPHSSSTDGRRLLRRKNMHEMICDCPFSQGFGECALELNSPPGTRKYPAHCPKISSLRNEKICKDLFI
jgi:hypothetical protein